MTSRNDDTASAHETCRTLLDAFFHKYPDEVFRAAAQNSLETLVAKCQDLRGQAGGWAGGLVYAISRWALLRPRHVILNSELEEVFGVTIGTIRKRAQEIAELVDSDVPGATGASEESDDFTLRDEANGICAYAFRNGFVEDIHASVDSDGGPRITDPEMKRLMIEGSTKPAKLLEMKQNEPEQYARFIRNYGRMYCYNWER